MAIGRASRYWRSGCRADRLEEGNKDDWFGSRDRAAVRSRLSLFIRIELSTERPLLNLRLLLRRNFGLGSIGNVIVGMALYGSVYLVPNYLSQMQGYNAQQVGEVLASTALPQLVLIPFVPRLMRRFDPRLLVVVGLALFAASCFMNGDINRDYSGPQFLVPNLVRAIGQALIMTPLSMLATGGIEQEQASSASALFNMMRNLGGSVGIALLQTLLTRREQFHSAVINPSVSLLNEATRQRLAGLQQYFMAAGTADPATAWHDAVGGGGPHRPGAIIFPRLWRHVFHHGDRATAGDRRGGDDATDCRHRRRRALTVTPAVAWRSSPSRRNPVPPLLSLRPSMAGHSPSRRTRTALRHPARRPRRWRDRRP